LASNCWLNQKSNDRFLRGFCVTKIILFDARQKITGSFFFPRSKSFLFQNTIMEGFNSTFNVTMQAYQYLTQAYTYCYIHLKEANINLPAPDQVISVTASTISYILSHSPSFVRQLYATLSQLPIENNFMTIFLLLVILYVIYCSVMATFRWMYRLLYGFVRFSFFIALFASIIYVVQQYVAGAALFPGSATTDKQETKSF
jgi:hypothetical protein